MIEIKIEVFEDKAVGHLRVLVDGVFSGSLFGSRDVTMAMLAVFKEGMKMWQDGEYTLVVEQDP
jgi:hypothetical protein